MKTGIIYKLVSSDIEVKECYVGSTMNFRTRKCHHKSDCNNENSKNHHFNVYQYIRANGNWDNWNMIQIEEMQFNNRRELHARERYWIETLKATLNKVVPTRTMNEYRQVNAEHFKKYTKQYYLDNSEHIKQYYLDNSEHIKQRQKQYRADNAEHMKKYIKQYYLDNSENIKQQQKQYYLDNSEHIKQQQKQKFDCPCGRGYTHTNRARHFKSKKHCQYEYQTLYDFIYS